MCTTNDDHIMYGSCDIKQDMSYWKNSWRYYHFKHEYHKWKSYGVWFLRYGAQQTEFFLILDHFLHFYTSLRNNPEMQNEKNTWRYHHFTQVYHKWQSYDIWFLRYEVHQPEFFCHLGSSWLDSDRILARLMIIGYTVPEIWHVTDVIVIFRFGLYFSLLPH